MLQVAQFILKNADVQYTGTAAYDPYTGNAGYLVLCQHVILQVVIDIYLGNQVIMNLHWEGVLPMILF